MNTVIIGGGAAGMFAALSAKESGDMVILIEKNNKLGRKLAITGKGRCNITFDGDEKQFLENIAVNSKFMLSSFNQFDNNDVISFFKSNGVETKIERGARIFPVSDNANDVVNAFEKELIKQKVEILLNSEVEKIITKKQDDIASIVSVVLKNGKVLSADKVIIATGGCSYKVTGSNGDGYKIAKELGHNVVEIKPGLVPIKCYDDTCTDLQGLSLKNVSLRFVDEENNKEIYSDFGEMMFAHFGITGPIVLSASSKLNRYKEVEEKIKNKKIQAIVDLKPALSVEQLDKRIQRDFEKYSNKEFKNSLDDLLPQKLISVIIKRSEIDKDKKVHQITKEEREKLVYILKNFILLVSGFMPIDLAIITCGGISTKEINPKTMESKLVKGLFFAGEILDIDAYTGGYNLQIAFSTGHTAGKRGI